MTSHVDPQQMSGAERKLELAEILAAAYLRSLPRRNRLDSSPRSEPSCPAVDAPEIEWAFGPSAGSEAG